MAGLLDLACMLAWIAVVVVIGVLLRWAGIVGPLSPLGFTVVGALTVVAPITVTLAMLEGGRYEASVGKQRFGLRVRRVEGPQLGFVRALVRNAVKIAVPGLFGHVAAVSLATTRGPVGADLMLLIGVSLLVPVVYLVSLFVGDRRPPYDLLASSTVVEVAAPRRSLG